VSPPAGRSPGSSYACFGRRWYISKKQVSALKTWCEMGQVYNAILPSWPMRQQTAPAIMAWRVVGFGRVWLILSRKLKCSRRA
jgi:hypothetical protein